MNEVNKQAVMARRGFVTTLMGVGALGALTPAVLGWSSTAHAQSTQSYKLIEPAMPTQDKSDVEVLEFFWFGCPHCYAFEPAINEWSDTKPDYVSFVREAPPLNSSWEQHSRTFYAAAINAACSTSRSYVCAEYGYQWQILDRWWLGWYSSVNYQCYQRALCAGK